MPDTTHLRRYPPTLRVAFQETHAKPDRFYGTEKGLATSRKRSAAKTKQRYSVLAALKRIGL